MNRHVYYRAIKRNKQRQDIATKVITMVQRERMKMPRIGTRKLYFLLYDKLQELGVGRDRLFSIMKANNLHIKPRKQYHITTDSHHRFRKHKNLIEQLKIERPEQVWVSDITYVGTRENPMYLSLVTDAYSKKIVGYDLSNSLHATGVIATLQMAIDSRMYQNKALIHHSDRGLQYCCIEYQQLLEKNTISCSMTEKYDPYQNAIAERVNGILKQEFIQGIVVKDIELMEKLIQETIYIYNQLRPHWSCHMHTPAFMHKQSKVKIKTYKIKNSIEEGSVN